MRYLNLKYIYLFIFSLGILSCEKDCSKLVYSDGLTTLNNKLFTGTCKSYYLTGNLKSVQSYKNGFDNGDWEFYFNNGNIQTKGSFSKGKKTGIWKYFFENGNIWKENFYDVNGSKTGTWKTFSVEGKLIDKITFN